MVKNNFKKIFGIWILVSLVFVIPASFSTVTTKSNAGSALCGSPVNIKDSFILSVVTMCLPGILEKAHEWKQIKCQTIKCSYNAVINDLDPSFCEKQEAYRTCKYFVGEIFAIPPMAILEYYRNAMSQALANPVGILWSTSTKIFRATIDGSCGAGSPSGLICNVVANVPVGVASFGLVATDSAAIVQTLMDIFKNGFSSLFPDETDYCEGIGDIKKELEKIVGVTNNN